MNEFNAARASTTGEGEEEKFREYARFGAPDDAPRRANERARHLKSAESFPGAINPLFPISARSICAPRRALRAIMRD